MLGVKTVVYLTPEKFTELEELKDLQCHYFEVKEHEKPTIDFDVISAFIVNEIKSSRGPVFMFDVSGIISAALSIRVMLEFNRAWSKEIATAFIFNKRYEAKDMPAWLYQQIEMPG